MARPQFSQRYLEEVVRSTLEGEVEELEIVSPREGELELNAFIYNDASDPEETRSFLEELVAGELSGWNVILDGVFVSRGLPSNLLTWVRSAAHFPEAVYWVQALDLKGEPLYRVHVRHQDTFLGKKRNRIQKLRETVGNLRVEVVPLGSQQPSNLLNTLPKVQEWLEPFAKRVPLFSPSHVHAYKAHSDRETLWVAHNARQADPASLRRLGRYITRQTDIQVQFELRMSRSDARSRIDEALQSFPGINGYHISFQEKQQLFLLTVDAEQTQLDALRSLSDKLARETDFRVDVQIDIEKDVMLSRIVQSFPADGILTWIKHIDEHLYEVEAYLNFDVTREQLEAWSDRVEAQWGARIMFSDPFARSPDYRFRSLRGSDAETIAKRYNRPLAFSEPAMRIAEQCAEINWEAELARRIDIRDTVVVSIDPERTRDIDDALSVVALPDGQLEVGVHIADVSAFVPKGSALDSEAMLRGFTTYLVSGEIPVIPPLLSDQTCSLHGGKDSLCMSVFMRFLPDGEMTDYRVERTVIHNHCRFAYAGAQKILDGKDPEHPFAWQVLTLGALSRTMRTRRKEAGALDLSLDSDPEKASHQLIEEFMLQANECVSRFLTENHPTRTCLFRVHPDVTEMSMAALRELAKHLRISVAVTDQASMQQALEEVLGTPSFDIFRFHVGRVLEKATYHVDQLGHGALSKADYAHFTSPIRRYTDLIIHRLIEDALYKEERAGKASYERDELQMIAEHLNLMEVRVDAGSFESHRLNDLQAYDGARRSYSGRILSFMRGRITVKLDQTDLLVNVRYRDLKAEKMMPIAIMDELSDRTFTLGEEVNVRTEGVDWRSKSIDARIVR